ncbi:MAG: CHAD domain-containing protein [Magnetococcales bacterium]|nr:CHAD domain-containing protein [Magnetococcales bacterium]
MTKPLKNKTAPISAKQSISEAFGIILRHNFEYMQSWAEAAYLGKDIEGVHQVRVAFRRMRSTMVLFRKAIPREITDPWSTEMRWIASEMGPARDLDVFIDEGLREMAGKIPLTEGEQKLMDLALKQQKEAYVRVRAMFDGERYKTFEKDFDLWLTNCGWFQADLSAPVRAKLNTSIRIYAAKVLNKRVTKVLQAGERKDQMSIDELHQLRIEGKKLRYATDFFSPMFGESGMAEFNSHLKSLQGLLGTMNDVSVMPGLIDGLLEGIKDVDTIKYAGAAIGWRAREYEEVRGELDARWTAFSNTAFPWLK